MNRLSVVIIDDDKKWCEILGKQLAKHTYLHIYPAITDGEVALEFIRTEKPDVIVLDLLMPKIDGYYIINYIRKHESSNGYHPYIYVVSAMGTAKTRELLNNMDVDYFSVKPINSSIVAENLYRLLCNAPMFSKVFPHSTQANRTAAICRVDDYAPTFELDQFVDDFLYSLGAPSSSISTKCTKEAIKYCVRNRPDPTAVRMTDVYKATAGVMGKSASPQACEKNIRTTLKRVSSASTALFEEIFFTECKLTNSEFIVRSARVIKQLIKEKIGDNISFGNDGKIYRS